MGTLKVNGDIIANGNITANEFLGSASHLGGYAASEYFRRGANLEKISFNDNYETGRSYWVTDTVTDFPNGTWGTLLDFAPNHSQLFFTYAGNESPVWLYARAKVNNVWQPWSKILQEGEDISISHLQIRGSQYPALHIYNSDTSIPSAGFSVNTNNNQVYITEHCLNNDKYEQYYLPIPATNLTANKAYNILTTKTITASTTELNYCKGVTSSIQTQLDSRWKDHGTITTSTNSDGSTKSIYGISDLNSATLLGNYWVQCAGIANTPFGDSSSGKYGLLEVNRCGKGAAVFQRFTTYGNSKTSTIYERDNVNGWKPWRVTSPYSSGVGSGAPYVDDVNACFNGGFYRWDTGGGSSKPFSYGSMLVIPRSEDSSAAQLAVCQAGSTRDKWMVRTGTSTGGFTAWDQLITSSICPNYFYYTHIIESGAITPTVVANAIKAGKFGSYNVFVARICSMDTPAGAEASEAVVIGSNAMVGSGKTHSAFLYCGYGWNASGQSNFFKCRIHDDVLETFEL